MENLKVDDTLIIKFLCGKTDSKESEKVLDWLNESHENRLYYFRLKRIWQESSIDHNDSDHVNKAWDNLKVSMNMQDDKVRIFRKNSEIKWNVWRVAAAASFLILIATSLFFGIKNKQLSGRIENSNRIFVPLGSRTNVILPDGSNVWLNSGSTLVYNSNFSLKGREVQLEGEGFFDIRHASNNSPFIVSAGGIKIKVLGTTFNVKCYPEENIVEATLVKGKVEVNTIGESNLTSPLILLPNQKLTYIKEEGTVNLSSLNKGIEKEMEKAPVPAGEKYASNFKITPKINPEVFTSWKDGRLIFNGETLENLVPRLERFYNVKITLEDESMKTFKYTGTLDEVTIEEVLRAIESTSPIRYRIYKNQVVLKMLKSK